MNYLEQIVAFYRWKEVNPLLANAIALWHELMAVCNKAGWPQEFTVPNAVLQSNAGLSRKEFDKARQQLITDGLILYKKAARVNNAGKYSMIPISIVQKGQQQGKQQGQQEGQQEGHRTAHTGDNARGTLSNKYKPNENEVGKQQSTRTDEDYELLSRISADYGHIFSAVMNTVQGNEVLQYIKSGMEYDLVIDAMKRSAVAGKDFRYTLGALKNMSEKGIQTVAQAEFEREQLKQQRTAANKRDAPLNEPKGWGALRDA